MVQTVGPVCVRPNKDNVNNFNDPKQMAIGSSQVRTYIENNFDRPHCSLEQQKQLKVQRKKNKRQETKASLKTEDSQPLIEEALIEAKVDYDPSRFRNENGHFDFTNAPGYDEEVVRFNINKVKHPENMVIAKPTAVKEVYVPPKSDFVQKNKDNTQRHYSEINQKRFERMRAEEEADREEYRRRLRESRKQSKKSRPMTAKHDQKPMPNGHLFKNHETGQMVRRDPAQMSIQENRKNQASQISFYMNRSASQGNCTAPTQIVAQRGLVLQ